MTTSASISSMKAEEAANLIIGGERLFILDVRNEADYADWKIEGKRVEAVNIPYFELLDGVDEALAALPADREVLVVCAKEGSSVFVARQLAEAGVSGVRYLEGGMKAWSEYVRPVKIGDLRGGGELYQFVRMGKGCLSYMIFASGEAAVIDAPRMTETFLRVAEERGARIRHTLDTHLHADHISGGRQLALQSGGTYWLPPKDAQEVMFDYAELADGARIAVGGATIEIHALHSPGHTIGSTSFLVDGTYLLTGDILFVASIGRPDLAGLAEDWAGDLHETLYERYRALPEELIVLPAHFGSWQELGERGAVAARLGDLFAGNPGLNMADETAFRRMVTEQLPRHPNAYEAIRQTNMGRLTPAIEEQREMESGPSRCAIHDN
ncbi:MBL fold metallo-hydrolase [Paenibacillus methanolicus]|uniref:Glyoxylase-like metal-dependent hydrolase (Beta-lactamase superfamily II) n=1 Tax=Paenibacillus methanolicus TaxID=582686 RepID=A0A5S5BSQ3_9BACL|nr:MBL fold metallo-hydrolase [Paenibacillus methanolicus]TYP70037.1 glyoxylase-like metal-dependent hydrolase (beta-lactamase superfamily II) [Paenibacillus methanolicus]